MLRFSGLLAVLIVSVSVALPPADSACCSLAANDKDIHQSAQQAFITWNPLEKLETFTVQPRFEGNAPDFGMVIPTPAQPKLEQMPKDFFKELAVFTILTHRESPQSKLLPAIVYSRLANLKARTLAGMDAKDATGINVLAEGVVGSLECKIITANKAKDLYAWLKENNYNYVGKEATLDSYIQKKWFFTVMKIDAKQMKKNADGSYTADVTPTRFQFNSDRLIYPLKIAQLCVKDKMDVLLYVQAPQKVDLPGDLTYQYQWIPMLESSLGQYVKGTFGSHPLPGKADDWLRACAREEPALLQRGEELGFEFVRGHRPQPNQQGRIATTLEWAKRLSADDMRLLKGQAPFCEKLPDVDEGYTQADVKDDNKAPAVYKALNERLANYRKERPGGFLVREAPDKDVEQLKILAGYVREGQFLTKIRKIFTKSEMEDDLLIVPAKLGQAVDQSEHEEVLPTSPP
jgi:Uncharacterized protein conserved in bacteria (DUF2330)